MDRGCGAFGETVRLIARERRAGQAENNTLLLREARGELLPAPERGLRARAGAAEALLEALDADPEAAAAGAQLYAPSGDELPCAWRLPGLGRRSRRRSSSTASGDPERSGDAQREVGWVQSCSDARPPRRRRRGRLPGPATSSSTPRRPTSRSAYATPGWTVLHVPAARGRPPRAARHRPLGRRPPRRPVSPRPRHLHAKAPLGAPPPRSRRVLSAWSLRAARARRAGPARATTPAGTGFTPASPPPLARRGHARRRRGLQPPPRHGRTSGRCGRRVRSGPRACSVVAGRPPRRPRARAGSSSSRLASPAPAPPQRCGRARRSPTGCSSRRSSHPLLRVRNPQREQHHRVGEPQQQSGSQEPVQPVGRQHRLAGATSPPAASSDQAPGAATRTARGTAAGVNTYMSTSTTT